MAGLNGHDSERLKQYNFDYHPIALLRWGVLLFHPGILYTAEVKPWAYIVLGVMGAVILAIIWGVVQRQDSIAPTVNQEANTNQTNTTVPANTNSTGAVTFSTTDLPDRDPNFRFTAAIPTGWVAEYVAGSQGINFYDPQMTGDSSLDRSQIFVKYFAATDFQTLTAVDIVSRTDATISGQPAMTYVIKKKATEAEFTAQPFWRNQEHRVTDIRSTDDSPAVFYIFAKAPSVTDAVFDEFLQLVRFGDASVSAPIEATEDATT